MGSSYIVTHGGQAHRDEFIAVCLLPAQEPRVLESVIPIFRRNPTDSELHDSTVFVVDVGGQYDSSKHNFDHHQFASDMPLACATTLVLEHYGALKLACAASPWVDFTTILDCLGPVKTAKHLGVELDAFHATISPVETQLLQAFQERDRWSRNSWMVRLMRRLGAAWPRYWHAFRERWAHLESTATGVIAPDESLILRSTAILGKDNPRLALEAYARKMENIMDRDVSATITCDDSGPGLCLFRRNDWPGLDLCKLKGVSGVTFVHEGGFVAKTHESISVAQAQEMLNGCYSLEGKKCVECGGVRGRLHHPSCGKRVLDAPYVIEADCVVDEDEEAIPLHELPKNLKELRSLSDKLANLMRTPEPGLPTWVAACRGTVHAIARFYVGERTQRMSLATGASSLQELTDKDLCMAYCAQKRADPEHHDMLTQALRGEFNRRKDMMDKELLASVEEGATECPAASGL